ncbi:hypothetical protein [Brachyspira catarrhinii]|uniref:Uncharacterized protein n=1 Tax=Brachyspira catarrhinii TaxID=2528966 RepID=A0ABY2TQX6_9SPIR|nr:hypothetical protein [Brachyspira catarrhinii]TKZ35268.1 hypothetical protein EZH24_06190 [Brachyspira catarrhinii]
MKFKLFIFTIILSIFYFQIISCKSNEEPQPVYSTYTGIVDPSPHLPSMYDIIDYEFRQFIVKEGLEEYRVMVQSDIDKLNEYATGENIGKTITIKATYSNNFKGNRTGAINTVGQSWDKYLFDISIVSAEPTKEKWGLLKENESYYYLEENETSEIYKLLAIDMNTANLFSSYLNKQVRVLGEESTIEENIKTIFVKDITLVTTVTE